MQSYKEKAIAWKHSDLIKRRLKRTFMQLTIAAMFSYSHSVGNIDKYGAGY